MNKLIATITCLMLCIATMQAQNKKNMFFKKVRFLAMANDASIISMSRAMTNVYLRCHSESYALAMLKVAFRN